MDDMLAMRYLFLILLIYSFNVYSNDYAVKPSYPCTKEFCLNDPDCLCWCSQICGWRKKQPDDHPFYIENDPHGKFCYCKHWDYDHYVDNCIEGKQIKEPKGAN